MRVDKVLWSIYDSLGGVYVWRHWREVARQMRVVNRERRTSVEKKEEIRILTFEAASSFKIALCIRHLRQMSPDRHKAVLAAINRLKNEEKRCRQLASSLKVGMGERRSSRRQGPSPCVLTSVISSETGRF